MSHLTHIKTRFQNLLYLQNVLNQLNIIHTQKEKIVVHSNRSHLNVIIPQSNGYDIEFMWNGQEYELILDISFWKQPFTIESFIDKISHQYTREVIIAESQKLGWQQIHFTKHTDGSNTLILERWN